MTKGKLIQTVTIAVFFTICLSLIAHHKNTDIYAHAHYLQQCINTRTIPDSPLFYGAAYLCAFGSSKLSRILTAMAIVLGASVAARFYFSQRILEPLAGDKLKRPLLSAIAAIGLQFLFCLPIPNEYWFASQFAPNLWHNSTWLFMMPFVVLLFNQSLLFLESGATSNLKSITLLVLANIASKPSFFFCFAAAFPLLTLFRKPADLNAIATAMFSVLTGLAALAIYYWYLFVYTVSTGSSDSAIGIAPFHVWSTWTHNIPLSFCNSLQLPLAIFLSYPRKVASDLACRYSLLLLLAGIALYAFLEETGSRMLDGNFWWQLPATNYLLHLSTLAVFIRLKEDNSWSIRDYAIAFIFIAGVISGAIYLARIVTTGQYY